jgi:hypothetical protein
MKNLKEWHSLIIAHTKGPLINKSAGKELCKKRENEMSRNIPWLELASFAGDFSFKPGPLLACFITITTNFYRVLACSDAVHDPQKSTNQRGAYREPVGSQEMIMYSKI